MRPSLFSLLALTTLTAASPFSRLSSLASDLEARAEQLLHIEHSPLLFERGNTCAAGTTSCGFYGQLCCTSSESCITDSNNQAQCVAAVQGANAAVSSSGAWAVYTSTWVETNLVTKTSVYSSWVPAATGTGTCKPNWANNESPCGSICCKSGQYCYSDGVCAPAGANGFTTTGVGPIIRPTTGTGVIVTQTASPTTTMAFQTPAPANNGTAVPSKSHLSGGAIAGIVIGVLLGIALLFLLCLFCCLKKGFEGILALLGIGRKKERRTRHVEETIISSRHRHGGAAVVAEDRRWYGGGGGRASSRVSDRRQKRTGGLGGMAAVTAGLGGLALALGLRRKEKRAKSEVSSTGYTYESYSYTDESASSRSDDRTRRSSRR
ncbi:hypothetical protein EJ06DRAFT_20249 [Trichodelitschia bisporula]|uniref:Mid2 domain-containing protein n=1 Tax=Trichodelitschia bisporula TaxID=703511 RepID=A0A6G1IAG7_9PEZI|nr:hypothetical protein EJ06DRAFT_20249 [Trichodelitschia bisporula]